MTKTKEIRSYLEMYGLDKNTQDICDALGCAPRTVQQARKDYKAELLKTSDEFYACWAEECAKKTQALLESAKALDSGNLEYICEGCDRADTTEYTCGVYAKPPSMYVRGGCCPFNRPKTVTKKGRVRVGQQKTNR
jgi:hypothetical protein